MRNRWFAFVLIGSLAGMTPPSWVQQQSAGNAPLTLHVNSRDVLTDVVVTDAQGHPVHGLSRTAFQIFDDGRAETLNAFEEHSGAPIGQPEPVNLPAGVHTNSFLLHAPSAVNALLIDTTNMDIVDQMALYKYLLRFVDQLSPGIPISVFLRKYEFTVRLQDFTSDHAAIKTAIRKAIPGLPMPGADTFSESAGLEQIVGYLGQTPGRKNLLWFTGGTSIFNHPGPWSNLSPAGASPNTDGSIPIDDSGPSPGEDFRLLYDRIEAGRIAVYPIDVRGLNPSGVHSIPSQHLYETAFAEATGGEAFFNLNNIATAAALAMERGDSYYTLSYAPNDLRENGSWHTVRVRVDGPYTLSYRRGYYDDPVGAHRSPRGKGTTIRAGGQDIDAPNPGSRPLIFRTQLAAEHGSAARGADAYRVHYDIPAVELQHTVEHGDGKATVGAAIVAFDQNGKPIGHVSQQVTLAFQESLYKAAPMAALSFDQIIDLPKKTDAYLYIAVWDASNGRMGDHGSSARPEARGKRALASSNRASPNFAPVQRPEKLVLQPSGPLGPLSTTRRNFSAGTVFMLRSATPAATVHGIRSTQRNNLPSDLQPLNKGGIAKTLSRPLTAVPPA